MLALLGAVWALPAGARSQPSAQARLTGCHPSPQSAGRQLVVRAQIRRIRGARALALRFDLIARRSGAHRFVTVSGIPGFGSWKGSPYGLGPWTHYEQVESLAPATEYRVRVAFRWYGRHHRVLRTEQRTTGVCRQPDLRPQLVVQQIQVRTVAGRTDVSRYVATVVNSGRGGAGRFAVAFDQPGQTRQVHTVFGLRAGQSVPVAFDGPACSASELPTFTLDPDNRVEERDHSNDAFVLNGCPPS